MEPANSDSVEFARSQILSPILLISAKRQLGVSIDGLTLGIEGVTAQKAAIEEEYARHDSKILLEPEQASAKLKAQLVRLESLAWLLFAIGKTCTPSELLHRHRLLELSLLPVDRSLVVVYECRMPD